jgi:uncharacterized cupredoxin-like copper-binding protein
MPALAVCAPSSVQTVGVTLSTFGTTLTPDDIRPGTVRFVVENVATDMTHEFILVRTDLAPDQLPVEEDGKIDEESPPILKILTAEDVTAGSRSEVTVTLTLGHYVYFCNIDAHHMIGMRGEFTVRPPP